MDRRQHGALGQSRARQQHQDRMNQREKAERFQALHKGPAFVIPNPWDSGSARILAGLGFQALATSSRAAAGVLGRRDRQITPDEEPAQERNIVAADGL